MFLSAAFGASRADLDTVGYQLYNADTTAAGARTTTGVVQVAPGQYAADVPVPAAFSGYVVWDTGQGGATVTVAEELNTPRVDVRFIAGAPPDAYIADSVWDELLSGHTAAGSAGAVLAAAGGPVALADGAITAAKIADGAFTDAKFALPAETPGAPAGVLAMLRRAYEWARNPRTRDRADGKVTLRTAADSGDLDSYYQRTDGGVDTLGAAASGGPVGTGAFQPDSYTYPPAGGGTAPRGLGGVWAAPGPDDAADPGVLRKRAGGRLYAAFDFGDLPEVWAGAAVSSAAVSASPAGLTLGSVDLTGQRGDEGFAYRAALWVEGGAAGHTYRLTCTATLSDGSVAVAVGDLDVV